MGSIKGVLRGKYKRKLSQPDGNVYCYYCNKSYKKKSSLLQHIRAHHLRIERICLKCSRSYNSVSSLNRHKKNKHKTKSVSVNYENHKHRPLIHAEICGKTAKNLER